MGEVTCRNYILGDGNPKICVPITGRTEEEILQQSEAICKAASEIAEQGIRPAPVAEIIEFRADFYENVCNQTMLTELLEVLRERHKDRLILFTFRSEEEGGELRHDRAGSMLDDICSWAMVSGCIDLLDVELLSGNYRAVRTATKAKDSGLAVVMSYHNFEETPHNSTLENLLWDMEQLGGDILKIAVTPKNHFDVERVMEMITDAREGKLKYPISKPVVMISMTAQGEASRTRGAKLGSAFTFGSVGNESAPGQLSLEQLAKALKEA